MAPIDARESVTSLDAAYSAGLLDGEGNIYIGLATRGQQYRLSIQIMNTNHAVLEWLKARWGGSIYEMRGNSRHTDWARCWAWAITHRDDRQRFLKALLPYLIIKRRAAEIALRFIAVGGQGIGRRLPPAVAALRRELFLEIRGLTQPDEGPPVTINDDQLVIRLIG